MNTNEHECEEGTQYTECYVAYLDILGFTKLVSNGTALSALVRALNTVVSLDPAIHEMRNVHYNQGKCIGVSNHHRWVTQIRAFSDCVVLFVPTKAGGLSSLLCMVRYLYDRLLELKYCLRGAVAIGDMYWDDAWSRSRADTEKATDSADKTVLYDRNAPSNALITLGPALIEAYELESTVAVYPRVVFSPKLVTHVDKMVKEPPESSALAGFLCAPTPENRSRTILEFIRMDSDGVPFLDLFNRDMAHSDTEQIEHERLADGKVLSDGVMFEQFMRRTRKTIEHFLGEDNNDKVRAKHLWLANYFNASLAQHNIDPLPVEWAELSVLDKNATQRGEAR